MLRKNTLWMFPLAFVTLLSLMAACGSAEVKERGDEAAPPIAGQRVGTDGGVYYDVSPQELGSMLDSKDFLLVNVHIPYEGQVDGTDLFLPYDEISERLDQLPSQREAKIVVYCRSGSMSATAAKTLVRLGYTNVWNLDGGMIAWEEAGFPLIDAQS